MEIIRILQKRYKVRKWHNPPFHVLISCIISQRTKDETTGPASKRLFRAADDPNMLVLVCEWDTAENARQFLSSAELRQSQKDPGVIQLPETFVMELIDKG